MRVFPRGAWFGLTKRKIRILGISAGVIFAAFGLLCGAGRLLLGLEARRAASFLAELQSVKLGQSAASVAPLISRYEDTRREREMGTDPDTHILRVDPWHLNRPFMGPDWLDTAIRRTLGAFGNSRRNLGARAWAVYGDLHMNAGKVQSVSADLVVEGENEWLLADWNYMSRFSSDGSESDREKKDLPPEMDRFRMHWTHLHMGGETGEGIVNSVTSLATREELNAARNINLKCLTDAKGCHSLCDLMPDANRFRREHNNGGWGWNSGSWGKQPHDCE